MPPATPSTLQRILEARLTQLAGELQYAFEAELTARVSREVEAEVEQAVERASADLKQEAREAVAEELNLVVRRMRQAGGFEEASVAMLDGASGFAAGCALFRVVAGRVKGLGARGVPDEHAAVIRALEFPLAEATAFAGAVETRDPVVALAAPGQIPAVLRELAGLPDEGKVLLIPVSKGEAVPALLLAWGRMHAPALELLAQIVAPLLPPDIPAAPPEPPEAPEVPEPPALVRIEPVPPPAPRPRWEDLPAEEQRLHLAAQRFARVRVAEIVLQRQQAVRDGHQRGDLYGALREPIDAAREEFSRKYMAAARSMVDYLHLELVATLAHDDDTLLGHDYPGPLV